MSEKVENMSEENSAHQNEATAPQTEDVTANNIETAAEAVPVAVEKFSDTNENADGHALHEEKSSISPKVDNKKTPAKRTPSKRMSFIERAQKESEELVKNMGGSLEIEGGRRTRSSTRGTPTRAAAISTPPPSKKARSSPANSASTPARPRGRGRKIDVTEDTVEDEETKATPNKKKTVKDVNTTGKGVAENEEVDQKLEETTENEKKYEDKTEDLTESNPKIDESEKTHEIKETEDEKVIEKTKQDEIDTALDPVVEETESQVAADSLPTTIGNSSKNISARVEVVAEIAENDSPLETDDVKSIVTDKKTALQEEATNAEQQKVKEPSPEPMEIDSSPKSNDDSDIMEQDVVDTIIEKEVVKAAIQIEEPCAAETTPANVNDLNNVEKLEGIKEKAATTSSIGASSTGIVTNNSIAKSDIAKANETNVEEATHTATTDVNKTDHDLCEPKIATSPPISATTENSTTTTPQTRE